MDRQETSLHQALEALMQAQQAEIAKESSFEDLVKWKAQMKTYAFITSLQMLDKDFDTSEVLSFIVNLGVSRNTKGTLDYKQAVIDAFKGGD